MFVVYRASCPAVILLRVTHEVAVGRNEKRLSNNLFVFFRTRVSSGLTHAISFGGQTLQCVMILVNSSIAHKVSG